MIGKRKLFAETVRERIIETLATVSGIFGGFYGAILLGEIKAGVIYYSIIFSVFGGLAGVILGSLICGITRTRKIRIFFERFISNVMSVIGGILFGMTLGGFFAYFLNHPFFSFFYSQDIYVSTIAIDSNLGDGILIGGVAGGISCGIGSVIDTCFSFILDIFLHFTGKPEYTIAPPADKAPEKITTLGAAKPKPAAAAAATAANPTTTS
ncbi:hypothetical protein HY745_01650 [Candidatus Desantisbacteria bacterium]|nr:hypothetical protein [Candidatus Desantisbacteria bacterium]